MNGFFRFLWLTTATLVLASPARGQDFNWSWDKKAASAPDASSGASVAGVQNPELAVESAAPAPEPAGDNPVAKADAAAGTPEGFSWSWDKKAVQESASNAPGPEAGTPGPEAQAPTTDSPAVSPAPKTGMPEATPEARPSGGAISSTAYSELIQENLELRKKIANVQQDKEAMKKENERLASVSRDLEQKIAETVSRIKELQGQRTAPGTDPEKVQALEARLTQAEDEKKTLNEELGVLRKRMELTREDARAPAGAGAKTGPSVELALKELDSAGIDSVKSAAPRQAAESAIKPGSDLFVKMERENVQLRQKLAQLETEKRRALKAQEAAAKKEQTAASEAREAMESRKAMEEKLDAVVSTDKKQKKMMAELAGRVPEMEKELGDLKKKIAEKDTALAEREKNMEALARELETREYRIRKAERISALLEQAKRDVSQVNDSEKRDMHFNMAVVYNQVGRYRDAEREYLRALQLDPTDADVHYNLGILYDEALSDKARAAMHYRRYLKLRPNGNDVDAVRNWLTNIEISMKAGRTE